MPLISLVEPEPGNNTLWEAIRVMEGLFDAATPTEAITQSLQAFGSHCLNIKLKYWRTRTGLKNGWINLNRSNSQTNSGFVQLVAEPPDPSAANIMLDPGMAFGTGAHATTALMLNMAGQQIEWKIIDRLWLRLWYSGSRRLFIRLH